ncbi:MAG: hypothetical protein ACLP5H_13730 [Desulfomonilaceae bacterium]
MMKIPNSVRDSHAAQKEAYKGLRTRVDGVMRSHIDPRWHYESRIKGDESFALKAETGRFDDLSRLEDFFACTIVVENLSSMSRAEKLVRKKFKFYDRRPQIDTFTSKPPDSFRFDDTRLYVQWKDDRLAPPTGFAGMLFEVQIKTFLAHAWSIATHDLTYKADEKSWPKERIAFQIKAMLEHAETAIQEAQKLAKSASLRKTDKLSKRISAVIQLLNDSWPPASLPEDKKRLAENIDNLIQNVGIDLDRLREVIRKETSLGRGTETLNLSPYLSIVQSLFNQELQKMSRYVTGRNRNFKIFIPRELELPASLQAVQLTNAVLLT